MIVKCKIKKSNYRSLSIEINPTNLISLAKIVFKMKSFEIENYTISEARGKRKPMNSDSCGVSINCIVQKLKEMNQFPLGPYCPRSFE